VKTVAGGRPSKYYSNVEPKLLLIEAWCRDGLTEAQICDNLDVSQESFIQYKKQFPELVEVLKKGKEVIDIMVENALLKAALGYEYEETKETADGFERSTKMAHPNTTALIFWLKNRKPQQWRDKQEVDMNAIVEYSVKLPEPKGTHD
jgi:hypothetical protein